MNKQKTSILNFAHKKESAQQGSVLLEALVAILLFSMGVLALVGLQAAMIKNTADSKSRSEASYIAQQWIGRMWADPANAGAYLVDNVANNVADYDISAMLPNGTRAVSRLVCVAPWDTTNCPFVITITWQQPGQTQHTFTTTFTIS